MVRGLWDRQLEAIIDIKIGDIDTDYYKYEPMAALLDRWWTINNEKHDEHSNDKRKHSLFFI